MNFTWSSGVFLLFISSCVLLTVEGEKSCEAEIVRGCITSYKALFKDNPSNDQHCSRVQKVVSCFAANPSCKGNSVNRFRLWILQEAMLEVKLNICPHVDFKSLKDSAGNTDEAKKHGLVENLVDGDSPSPCAAEVHKRCSKRFLELLMNNQRICSDAVDWFACYGTTASQMNCNSPIIAHYANFVDKVGRQLFHDALLTNSCKGEL